VDGGAVEKALLSDHGASISKPLETCSVLEWKLDFGWYASSYQLVDAADKVQVDM
jgi:hypothetical protein